MARAAWPVVAPTGWRRAGPDDVVVVLLPDGGRGYLSKIFDDGWMADYGFLDVASSEPKVGAIVAASSKDGRSPTWCTSTPTRRSARPSPSCASSACRRCRWSGPSRR